MLNVGCPVMDEDTVVEVSSFLQDPANTNAANKRIRYLFLPIISSV